MNVSNRVVATQLGMKLHTEVGLIQRTQVILCREQEGIWLVVFGLVNKCQQPPPQCTSVNPVLIQYQVGFNWQGSWVVLWGLDCWLILPSKGNVLNQEFLCTSVMLSLRSVLGCKWQISWQFKYYIDWLDEDLMFANITKSVKMILMQFDAGTYNRYEMMSYVDWRQLLPFMSNQCKQLKDHISSWFLGSARQLNEKQSVRLLNME